MFQSRLLANSWIFLPCQTGGERGRYRGRLGVTLNVGIPLRPGLARLTLCGRRAEVTALEVHDQLLLILIRTSSCGFMHEPMALHDPQSSARARDRFHR